MKKDELKAELCTAVDEIAKDIKAYADEAVKNAELGYFETRTSNRVARELEKLGLEVEKGLALTGLRANVKSNKPGPNIGIIGELDGVTCRSHPFANPDTGASHACGHNLQISMMLAVAGALAKTNVMDKLSGQVSLLATPAEEFIDIERRKGLHDEGKITYFCGKQEFIKLGIMDDIDMSMMVHAGENVPGQGVAVPDEGNGFRIFMLNIKGVQAHAAAAPEAGINALHAAVAGINAVNALRETFRDEDHVRVHYIITKGGDSANSVPDDVRLEGYVRAISADKIDEVFDRVMKAFKSAAESIGAKCYVTSIPGDMPLKPSFELNSLFADNAKVLIGEENVKEHTMFKASTDMGDLMHVMPALHGFSGGVTGALHSKDFTVLDFDAAVIVPAKAMLMTIVDLLADDAKIGREIVSSFKPVYTKEEYLNAMDGRYYSEL